MVEMTDGNTKASLLLCAPAWAVYKKIDFE